MSLVSIFLRTAAMAAFYVAGMFGGHYILGMSGPGLAVFSLACLCLFLPAQLAAYKISDRPWVQRLGRWHTANKSPRSRWVVAQDFRPFGFRVEGRYRTKWRAQLKASGSSYWQVGPLAYVEAETRRLSDMEEVMRDARRVAMMRQP